MSAFEADFHHILEPQRSPNHFTRNPLLMLIQEQTSAGNGTSPTSINFSHLMAADVAEALLVLLHDAVCLAVERSRQPSNSP